MLKNKVVVITGGGRGLGRSLVLALAKKGARVATCSRNKSELDDLKTYTQNLGLNVIMNEVNVADLEEVIQWSGFLKDKYGLVDVLINNAAVLGDRSELAFYPAGKWREVMEINVNGVFYVTQNLLPLILKHESASPPVLKHESASPPVLKHESASLPVLKHESASPPVVNSPKGRERFASSPKGCIINVTSGVGRAGRAYWGAYAVSKFAVEGFTQVMAEELKESGIMVVAVNPGATRTRMRAAAYPNEDPMTLPHPDEIAPAFIKVVETSDMKFTGKSLDVRDILKRIK